MVIKSHQLTRVRRVVLLCVEMAFFEVNLYRNAEISCGIENSDPDSDYFC
jgi:hypothetical protein